MEFDKIKEIAKNNGIKIKFFSKNLYKLLAPKISDNEDILCMAEGLDEKSANKAPIVVTTKNVYIIKYSGVLFGVDCLNIPISKISSVSTSGAILSKISINEGTVVYEIKNIARDKAELVSTTILNIQSDALQKTTSHLSSVDEIRKFKSLLDEGIISIDEFEKKKKELLSL